MILKIIKIFAILGVFIALLSNSISVIWAEDLCVFEHGSSSFKVHKCHMGNEHVYIERPYTPINNLYGDAGITIEDPGINDVYVNLLGIYKKEIIASMDAVGGDSGQTTDTVLEPGFNNAGLYTPDTGDGGMSRFYTFTLGFSLIGLGFILKLRK